MRDHLPEVSSGGEPRRGRYGMDSNPKECHVPNSLHMSWGSKPNILASKSQANNPRPLNLKVTQDSLRHGEARSLLLGLEPKMSGVI